MIKEQDVEHIQVDIGETTMHAAVVGQGEDVLMIHGWNNNWYGFWPLIAELAQTHRVTAVDLPGYGESGDLEGEYTFERMADAVATFIKRRDMHPRAVISLSMGTFVTSVLARQNPELMDSIVLMGAPVHRNKTLGLRFFGLLMWFVNLNNLTRTIGKSIINLRQYSYFTCRFLNMYKFDKELVDTYGRQGVKLVRKRALFQVGRFIPGFNFEKSWQDTTIPICTLFGREDKLADLEFTREICDQHSHMKYAAIPQAGHIVSLEQPSDTAEEIRAFLG